MRLLAMLLLVFTFIGCTSKSTCDFGKSVTGLVAAQLTTTLACKNLDAVKADIDKRLVDLKICEKAPSTMQVKSAVGDVICKPLIDGLIGGLVGQIPSAWECTGGQVGEDLKAKLVEACSKAL